MHVICIWSSWCHRHPIIACFIKIKTGVTFLVLTYPGCPGKRPLNRCLSAFWPVLSLPRHALTFMKGPACENYTDRALLGQISKKKTFGNSKAGLYRPDDLLLLNWQCQSTNSKHTADVYSCVSITAYWAYLWPPYVIGGPLYFCPVVSFFFLSFFFLA